MPASDHQYLPDELAHSERKQWLVLDTHLCVKTASASFYSTFDTTPAEVIGKELGAAGRGQWNIPMLLTMLNELPEGEGESGDFAMAPDSLALPPRRILVEGWRLPVLDGAPTGLIVVSIEDAAAQKGIEEETGESLARVRTTLASIADAVIATDVESRITFMNPVAERLSGWRKKNALHRLLADVFPLVNEQSVKIESPVERAMRAGEPVGAVEQAVLVASDGSRWPVDESAAPILDAAGRITGVVLVLRETGERRRAAKELASSELRYRRLFEETRNGIAILDAETGKILEVNRLLAEFLGRASEHCAGKELWEIGLFPDAESNRTAWKQLEARADMRYDELAFRAQDGRQIPVELASSLYQEGRRTLIQCNIRDISDRKKEAGELAKAQKGAEAASQAKSEFLANMSHEIRTPMSAILGFAEMLLEKSPAECAEIGCARIIRQNALHVLELMNDILDLSKVEAGHMKAERVSFDLPALVSSIVALARPQAADKGLGFEVHFEGPIPRTIESDPERLRQILLNLIANAMKFTESGKIDLRIRDEGAGGANIRLRVDVIDSGIGMTPEQLGRLFQPFMQGDESIAHKFGGTGLGLAISRQLAKALGGDVTATSQARLGSTFSVQIDGGASAGVETVEGLTEATLPAKLEAPVKNEIYLRGRILLVEDGVDTLRLLRMQLGSAGASVVCATNGQRAVELATAQPFDLILMDMQMPVMDGYAATAELRRRGVKIPIIALTAYAMAQDREKCMASGCDGYLSKPVDEETLLAAVSRELGDGRTATASQATKPQACEAPTAVQVSGSIRSSLAGDARMREILPSFVERLPGKVQQMLELLGGHDLLGLQKVVHDLAGNAVGYGFGVISPCARRAEQAIRSGADLAAIAAEIASLIELVRRIDGYEEGKVPAAIQKAAN
jgi:PAS domain S-box-containing protein